MFTQKEIKKIKRSYIKRKVVGFITKLTQAFMGITCDAVRFIAMIVISPILVFWATVKAAFILILHSVLGLIAGFTGPRIILFISDLCAWLVMRDSSVYHHSNLVRYLPALVAAVILICNSIHYLIEQLVFYEIGECFSDVWAVLETIFESMWIYQCIDDIRTFDKDNTNVPKPLSMDELKEIAENKMNMHSGVNTHSVQDEADVEKERELSASADIFGECFTYEEIADKYKELYSIYHPEIGSSPDKEAFEYLMLAFKGTTKWIATDKDLLEYIK